MRKMVSIETSQFSKAFWHRVKATAGDHVIAAQLDRILLPLSGPAAVSREAAIWLFCLVIYYFPRTICEIGTYYGRSTTAMALAMESGTIWTCDKDVNVPVAAPDGIEIKQHHSTSTAMLRAMTDPIDLFFFDGRVQEEDVDHIQRLSHEHTVYVFDDFEQLEKGVHNALKLMDRSKLLITENGRLAVAIPKNTIATPCQ